MKKGVLIFLAFVVVVGGSVFLGLRYREQQRMDARATIDRAFLLMDTAKDGFDDIKATASPTTVRKVNDLFQQILPKLDQAEKAFSNKKYSEATMRANEVIELTNRVHEESNPIPMK